MNLMTCMNDRIKRFTVFDVKLAQGAAMCVILIIVKLIPQIMTMSVWWFVVLAIVFAIRPMYLMFFSK
jgi:hypothetical protein